LVDEDEAACEPGEPVQLDPSNPAAGKRRRLDPLELTDRPVVPAPSVREHRATGRTRFAPSEMRRSARSNSTSGKGRRDSKAATTPMFDRPLERLRFGAVLRTWPERQRGVRLLADISNMAFPVGEAVVYEQRSGRTRRARGSAR
jgi:hypothetical protein